MLILLIFKYFYNRMKQTVCITLFFCYMITGGIIMKKLCVLLLVISFVFTLSGCTFGEVFEFIEDLFYRPGTFEPSVDEENETLIEAYREEYEEYTSGNHLQSDEIKLDQYIAATGYAEEKGISTEDFLAYDSFNLYFDSEEYNVIEEMTQEAGVSVEWFLYYQYENNYDNHDSFAENELSFQQYMDALIYEYNTYNDQKKADFIEAVIAGLVLEVQESDSADPEESAQPEEDEAEITTYYGYGKDYWRGTETTTVATVTYPNTGTVLEFDDQLGDSSLLFIIDNDTDPPTCELSYIYLGLDIPDAITTFSINGSVFNFTLEGTSASGRYYLSYTYTGTINDVERIITGTFTEIIDDLDENYPHQTYHSGTFEVSFDT